MSHSRRKWITGGAVGLVAPTWLACRGAEKRGAAADERDSNEAGPAERSGGTSAARPLPLERLEVRGGARLRGQAHGAAHRDLIAGCVSSFMQQTAALREKPEASLRWEQAVDAVAKKLGIDAPEALEELEGIAAEAGVERAAHLAYALEEDLLPELDVALTRKRIETWLASDVFALPSHTGKVTRVVFRMASDGPLTLIDHVGELVETPMLVLGRPGTLGCFGINREGLACARQPMLDGRLAPEGSLSNAIFRQVLRAKNYREASHSVNDWLLKFGASFFVADPEGAVAIESDTTSSRILGRFALSAIVAHTNHRIGPVPPDDALAQASLERLKVLRSLFPSGADPALDKVIEKFQAETKRPADQTPRLMFAANLKPSGTQLSWRSELPTP